MLTPRIHAVTFESRHGAELSPAAFYGRGHGMDPQVKPEDDEVGGAFGVQG